MKSHCAKNFLHWILQYQKLPALPSHKPYEMMQRGASINRLLLQGEIWECYLSYHQNIISCILSSIVSNIYSMFFWYTCQAGLVTTFYIHFYYCFCGQTCVLADLSWVLTINHGYQQCQRQNYALSIMLRNRLSIVWRKTWVGRLWNRNELEYWDN